MWPAGKTAALHREGALCRGRGTRLGSVLVSSVALGGLLGFFSLACLYCMRKRLAPSSTNARRSTNALDIHSATAWHLV
jgi:hypothetical protein